MGADIYLMSVYEKNAAEWRPKFDEAVRARDAYRGADPDIKKRLQAPVEEAYEGMYAKGYFRDSYNPTSLFWLLGLSWWNDSVFLKKKPGYMGVKAAKALLSRLQNDLQVTDERFAEWERKKRAEGWKFSGAGGESTPDEWKEMFRKKHADLCALLRQSIELGEPLRCSV
jgi:hypothetical protein